MPHIIMALMASTLAFAGVTSLSLAQDAPLSLAEAVLLAQQADEPSVEAWRARAEALEHRGLSESALPDPMVRVGLANVPLRTFDLNQEAMTQTQIGVRQAFPRGDTRRLSREIRQAEAQSARATMAGQERRIVLDVRLAWLESYYWHMAAAKIRNSRETIRQLGEVVEAGFSTGRQNSHNVFRIELETRVLDSKLIDIERNIETAQADLMRYLDFENATRSLTPALPVLPPLSDEADIRDSLARHPEILAIADRIEARDRGVQLAEQQYKPGWAIDAGYGLRGSRSDMGSVGVSMEIPLFSRQRQDGAVSAARSLRDVEELTRDAALLDMNRMLEREYARYRRQQENAVFHESELLVRARETAEAVMSAYENEVSDFAELVRAELALLDAELALTRLQIDGLQTQSRLLYLAGDL